VNGVLGHSALHQGPIQRPSAARLGRGRPERGSPGAAGRRRPERDRPAWADRGVRLPRHYIVVDLGYGDAGKGTVVDWLCSGGGAESVRTGPVRTGPVRTGPVRTGPVRTGPVHTVVRFNGGAQAGHNVVAGDGRHHTFAQFGSGTFTPGVRTHLSRFMLVDPLALAAEAGHLASAGVPDALDRLTVEESALLTTPYHAAANQARELGRGTARHGSCGMGIGETARYALQYPGDAPQAHDCLAPRRLAAKLDGLRRRLEAEVGTLPAPPAADITDAYREFARQVRLVGSGYLAQLLRRESVVFEGAQGVLLDEWHGFHPYTTWSTTTFQNADVLLAEAGMGGTGRGQGAGLRAAVTRIGVTRCYQTRHGPGPFVTEDPALELPEPHNARGMWQGEFRAGHLDVVALRYALQATGGADVLALTHLDTAAGHPELRVCRSYEIGGKNVTRLPAGRAGDLGAQEALTRRLLRSRPVLDDPGTDWIATVESELGVPVALASYGPRAADKRIPQLAATR
jgi:adenylosuccinate synthase